MPHNLNTDGQLGESDRQCLGGGEDWGQGDGLPRPHATSWKGRDLEILNFYIDYEAFKQWH